MQSTMFGTVKFQPLKHEALGIVSPNFNISTSQCSTDYVHDGNGDVLETVAHQNVCQVTVTNTHKLDHLPMFSILDPVRTREALNPAEKLTSWELFQSFASEFILQISTSTLLIKLIKQHMTLRPLKVQHTCHQLEKLKF
jgi:hypothetical protein